MPEGKFATVREADYPVLKQLIPGLPDRFARWEHAQEVKRAGWMASWRGTAEFVIVDPRKFGEWCKQCRDAPSEHLLGNYVFEC